MIIRVARQTGDGTLTTLNNVLKSEPIVVSCSCALQDEDLFGRYVPTDTGFTRTPGFFDRAKLENRALVFDCFNDLDRDTRELIEQLCGENPEVPVIIVTLETNAVAQ